MKGRGIHFLAGWVPPPKVTANGRGLQNEGAGHSFLAFSASHRLAGSLQQRSQPCHLALHQCHLQEPQPCPSGSRMVTEQ
jgi:hypothetical protein